MSYNELWLADVVLKVMLNGPYKLSPNSFQFSQCPIRYYQQYYCKLVVRLAKFLQKFLVTSYLLDCGNEHKIKN